MSKLFVILPCYNEEDSIGKLISKWKVEEISLMYKGIKDVEMVVIDDGSRDNTYKIVDALKKEYPNITLLAHGVNKGLGQALQTGMLYCVQKGRLGDFICVMDSDNTHNPNYIQTMISKCREKNVDCVIASRFRKGAETYGVSCFRNMLSCGARLYYSFTLNVPNVRDYTCGYRLYSYDIIERLCLLYDNQIILENGFTCMVELLYKIHKNGGRFQEVPFILRYDLKEGTSKMKILRNCFKSFSLPLKIKRA